MDLEQATETINILYFIIRNDRSGQALIQTLAKKAREGGKFDSFMMMVEVLCHQCLFLSL